MTLVNLTRPAVFGPPRHAHHRSWRSTIRNPREDSAAATAATTTRVRTTPDSRSQDVRHLPCAALRPPSARAAASSASATRWPSPDAGKLPVMIAPSRRRPVTPPIIPDGTSPAVVALRRPQARSRRRDCDDRGDQKHDDEQRERVHRHTQLKRERTDGDTDRCS